MFPDEASFLLLQNKGLTISSHPTQNAIKTQIHKINNINFQSNCTHIAPGFSFHPPFIIYKIKDILIIPETPITSHKFHPKDKKTRNFMRYSSSTTCGLHFF